MGFVRRLRVVRAIRLGSELCEEAGECPGDKAEE
jgi:hypothetical protein